VRHERECDPTVFNVVGIDVYFDALDPKSLRRF